MFSFEYQHQIKHSYQNGNTYLKLIINTFYFV
uniref:Uncharacterized protein n=1 Tax=Anguilla anguilla TaxID=7936 RepID=A0A0E9XHS1_ANGAN